MPRPSISVIFATVACVAMAIPSAGCGGSGGADGAGGGASSPNATAAPPSSAPIALAADPSLADFPKPEGRTIQELANTLTPGLTGGPASTLYTPGRNRIAFGLIDDKGSFVYGKTAVYVARTPDGPARGPFLAPGDSLEVRPAFRSRTSSGEGDVKAIYHADVPLPSPGTWYVLTATKVGSKLYGTALSAKVVRTTPIPGVGDMAPRIETPTLASADGDVTKIDTREPADDMHDVSFKDVVGKQPVVLLFATPALCQSRVCGPVVDIEAQLHAAYGDDVAFIHNEVYVDNDPNKGLRPQLKAFGLTTEPWLFTIDRQGRVATRLEGAFGFEEFRAAVEKARGA